ncbi:TPA: HNH endonuclease [Burkholderia cenocepacia]|nr:HNH endonuclease [Burkholderia cenocepacia]HDR9810533.1 HNH endonuclease [Burkholderia cenocepacia]HDR9816669.1 HNH endonuclease [Burkholderia cenocepacia]HDR9827550.1 HNH endonuclease [Burkholderia cenocepacia]
MDVHEFDSLNGKNDVPWQPACVTADLKRYKIECNLTEAYFMPKNTAPQRNSNSEKRKAIPESIKREVLTEAGYICANPGCRALLYELHHITYVAEGGEDTAANLVALCPNCHHRVHSRQIHKDSVRAWKIMSIAINRAWTKETATSLLFLNSSPGNDLVLTGDGVVRFADLIVSGLAEVIERNDFVGEGQSPYFITYEPAIKYKYPAAELSKRAYSVRLTSKGSLLVEAWKLGDVERIKAILGEIDQKPPADDSSSYK